MTSVSSPCSQRGSVFLYILIGVFLFAALSYAVATSMRGNSGVSNERNKLIASEIIAAGNRFTEAVTRLRLKGVSKNAISFENNVFAPVYTNPNCTTGRCKVFDTEGGGLSWEVAPPGSTQAPWFFSGTAAVDGVGTSDAELGAFLPVLSADVCREINVLLGVTAPGQAIPYMPANLSSLDFFTGTYGAQLMTQAALTGRKSGCLQVGSVTGTALGGATVVDGYHFFQVLIAN